jgi:predicted membrane channel-forming protein YqfA (hemolysin III family)
MKEKLGIGWFRWYHWVISIILGVSGLLRSLPAESLAELTGLLLGTVLGIVFWMNVFLYIWKVASKILSSAKSVSPLN